MTPFHPLVHNAHLLTILGNFWPRKLDEERFPAERRLFQTEPDVQVLVYSQHPQDEPKGQIVMVHGLEGSSDAGYKRSMAQYALEAGFSVHRFNMRSCGGSDEFAVSNYHAGQTSDLEFVVRQLVRESSAPMFVCGFSLGGNVVLKFAGELGDRARGLVKGFISVSTPLDLAACVDVLARPSNYLYRRRFLTRLRERIKKRAQQHPNLYDASDLDSVRTVYQFDDRYTARYFGFGSADNYYGSQSSKNFIDAIRVPTLFIQAKDDPIIPFESYSHPAFKTNPNLTLVALENGGHLGFLARGPERFWLDSVVLRWIASHA